MNRKMFWLLAIWLCASTHLAHAQTKKNHHIGLISPASPSTAAANIESFRQALRDLGYVERENIDIEIRWAEGSAERFPRLIAELVRLKTEVIVVGGANGALAAKNAGITTPVVFAAVTDPLGYGLIGSLARPGGNITGVALAVGEGFSENGLSCSRKPFLRSPGRPSCGIRPTHLLRCFRERPRRRARLLACNLTSLMRETPTRLPVRFQTWRSNELRRSLSLQLLCLPANEKTSWIL